MTQTVCVPGLWVHPHPPDGKALSCPPPKLTPPHPLKFCSEAHPDPRGGVKQGVSELAPRLGLASAARTYTQLLDKTPGSVLQWTGTLTVAELPDVL